MRQMLQKYAFMFTAAVCLALTPIGFTGVAAQGSPETGTFFGVEGLDYRSATLSGTTNANGEFQYRPGETVTFSVGDLVLGSAPPTKGEVMTVAHLVLGVNGDPIKINEPAATNRARFLQSLDDDDDVENGVRLTSKAKSAVRPHVYAINFGQGEEAFARDRAVTAIFKELGQRLRSPAEARNHLRYTLYGIQAQHDVRIPMRDGAYVLGDIFRPIAPGRHPAIVGIGNYGKAPIRGCICNEEQRLEKAVTLDEYFMGNPEVHPYENHETADAAYWVRNGYAVVRIDGRGACNTPGVPNPYSVQEAEDFYDSIEWVADLAWSNGNIGTWGASYFGINQPIVASLRPPSLKAMVVSAGDSNRYRQVVFTGGISNAIARAGWNAGIRRNVCLGQKGLYERVTTLYDHTFDEPEWYGTYYDKPQPRLEISADLSKVTVPMLVEAPLEHTGNQHVRGSFITYMDAATPAKDKGLSIITGDFIAGWMYTKPALQDHLAFYDHYLKGVDNKVMETRPKVKMMVRTGEGGWFWQYENEFPVARTDYQRLYLNGAASTFKDGNRSDFKSLSLTEPSAETTASYSATAYSQLGIQSCWEPGVSFISEPLTEDKLLAGWIKLVTWVSSTSKDADVFASLRVIDQNGKEVPYALSPGIPDYPIGKGALKVSHRVQDPARSTVYLPYHTHREKDYAPLKGPNDVVKIEVELEPTTALVKAGSRIRLDVQPVDGCGWGTPHVYDFTYHAGATNTIYTGPKHQSYVQIPVVPAK